MPKSKEWQWFVMLILLLIQTEKNIYRSILMCSVELLKEFDDFICNPVSRITKKLLHRFPQGGPEAKKKSHRMNGSKIKGILWIWYLLESTTSILYLLLFMLWSTVIKIKFMDIYILYAHVLDSRPYIRYPVIQLSVNTLTTQVIWEPFLCI